MLQHATRPQVREFVCPQCWAEPGKLCRDLRGVCLTTNHQARTDHARQALAAAAGRGD